MALIEYDIQYDKKTRTSKVKCRILEVGVPDKIRFKSNDPKTAIQYKGGTPFDYRDPTAPQPDKAFSVGKKTKEFEVVKHLTREKRLRFKCGEGVPIAAGELYHEVAQGGGTTTINGSKIKLRPWKGAGGGTPPPDF
jgi:hypothetical protein